MNRLSPSVACLVFLCCLAPLASADWLSILNGGFEDTSGAHWTGLGGTSLEWAGIVSNLSAISPYQGSNMLEISVLGSSIAFLEVNVRSDTFDLGAGQTIGGAYRILGSEIPPGSHFRMSGSVFQSSGVQLAFWASALPVTWDYGWQTWSYTNNGPDPISVYVEYEGQQYLPSSGNAYMLVDSNDPPTSTVPEPGSLVLGLAVLGMLAGVRLRRRRD